MAEARRPRTSGSRPAAATRGARTTGATGARRTTTTRSRKPGDGEAQGAPASDRSTSAAEEGVCPVAFCPICTAVSVVNRASPEVVQHLLVAGQQFLMALKAVVDARASDFERDEADGREPSMQHIDIS